ncbi:hypothetical protein [Pantoea sp. BL1]|nr:hypothetical protein [Pantoea sp. BL1]
MTTYEKALFLTAGIVSGIYSFILSAYCGGSRTGPLAAMAYRGLAGDVQP